MNIPTYNEMLKMDSDEFKKLIIYRTEKQHRQSLIDEMIEHEEQTDSFKKTAPEEITDSVQKVMYVFDRNKSALAVEYFEKLNELGVEEDSEDILDLVQDAIFAKATSDKAGLGEEMETYRNQQQ